MNKILNSQFIFIMYVFDFIWKKRNLFILHIKGSWKERQQVISVESGAIKEKEFDLTSNAHTGKESLCFGQICWTISTAAPYPAKHLW